MNHIRRAVLGALGLFVLLGVPVSNARRFIAGEGVAHAEGGVPAELCGPSGIVKSIPLLAACTAVSSQKYDAAFALLQSQSNTDPQVIGLRAACLYGEKQFWAGNIALKQMLQMGDAAGLKALYDSVLAVKARARESDDALQAKAHADAYNEGLHACAYGGTIHESGAAATAASKDRAADR